MPRSGEAYKAASWYFRTGWMLGYIDTLHRLQRADLASRAAEWEADTTPMIAAGEAIAPKYGFQSADDLWNQADFDTLAQFHWDVAERVREEST